MASSCKYEGCKVPAEDGSDFCIFHDAGWKDLETFKKALNDQINEVGPAEARNKRFNFRGYVFPAGIVAGSSGGFEEPLIELPKTIEGTARFADATIKGRAVFIGATIEGDALFGGATIQGFAGFVDATITGEAVFSRATI